MKRTVLMVAVLTAATAVFAATNQQVIYVGGTSKLAAGTAGQLDTTQPDSLVFEASGTKLAIPYKSVQSTFEDSHLAHRMGVLPLVAVALLAPLHKRYYVQITYQDESNVAQFARFEVPREMQDTVRTIVEARRVKKPYQPPRSCCGGCRVQGSTPCAQ